MLGKQYDNNDDDNDNDNDTNNNINNNNNNNVDYHNKYEIIRATFFYIALLS